MVMMADFESEGGNIFAKALVKSLRISLILGDGFTLLILITASTIYHFLRLENYEN